MNQTPELIFRKTISEIAKQSEYIFLFRKLAFLENMYFSENILQQPNTPLDEMWEYVWKIQECSI